MKRFLGYLRLVLFLTALMFGTWWVSAVLLPQGILRPYFARLFSERVGEFTFGRILLANLVPFFGVQFMNLFKVGRHPGGIFVLPIFWIIYGLLLGTNSFVFAGQPVAFSVAVLWTRTGFMEMLAYTTGYEATKGWAVWEQRGILDTQRHMDHPWRPQVGDWFYWVAGLLLLITAVLREVQ